MTDMIQFGDSNIIQAHFAGIMGPNQFFFVLFFLVVVVVGVGDVDNLP
jgi:hypothetical protein